MNANTDRSSDAKVLATSSDAYELLFWDAQVNSKS